MAWNPTICLAIFGAITAGILPDNIVDEDVVEFLVDQGTVYPQGRRKTVMIKGVETDQQLLDLPSEYLSYEAGKYKMMLGYRMARKLELETGDKLMLRWRDDHGSFDAREFEVVHIFTTTTLTIDVGQVWLGLEQMQIMFDLPEKVTYFSYRGEKPEPGAEWIEKTQEYLLSEFQALFAAKMAGVAFMYAILLFLAMIAVFDTQVLAVFKRRKEVGMMMALGMPRGAIMRIFTLEGFLSGILAVILGFLWGFPLLRKFQENGLQMPDMMASYGVDGMLDAMYPQYTLPIVLMTVMLVLVLIVVVSYLPVSGISKMKAVEALK